jgi:hypothetical protein
MATLQAATTSTGVAVTDPTAVAQLCESYRFGMLNWEIRDGEFSIWGYDDLLVYEALPDGHTDYEAGSVTETFLRELSEYVEPGGELDIQTAGFTKCRFPVLARRYVVRHDEVLHADLSDPELITD